MLHPLGYLSHILRNLNVIAPAFLLQVFSQDKAICEAVENAFITIYITKNSLETAKNLLKLAIDSNIGDLAALESIIGALVFKGDVSSGTVT